MEWRIDELAALISWRQYYYNSNLTEVISEILKKLMKAIPASAIFLSLLIQFHSIFALLSFVLHSKSLNDIHWFACLFNRK